MKKADKEPFDSSDSIFKVRKRLMEDVNPELQKGEPRGIADQKRQLIWVVILHTLAMGLGGKIAFEEKQEWQPSPLLGVAPTGTLLLNQAPSGTPPPQASQPTEMRPRYALEDRSQDCDRDQEPRGDSCDQRLVAMGDSGIQIVLVPSIRSALPLLVRAYPKLAADIRYQTPNTVFLTISVVSVKGKAVLAEYAFDVSRSTLRSLSFEPISNSGTAICPVDSPTGRFTAYVHVSSSTSPSQEIRAFDIVTRQKNSWVSSGAGSLPSE
jgi:hypothetical protein